MAVSRSQSSTDSHTQSSSGQTVQETIFPRLDKLVWMRIVVRMEAEKDGYLPTFLGSALRGAIGPRLDLVIGSAGHSNPVPPFTINTRLRKRAEIRQGETLSWGLVLIGDLRDQLEEIILVLRPGMQLGEKRIPFRVIQITPVPGPTFSPADDGVAIVPRLFSANSFLRRQPIPGDEARIRFLTPLRLVRENRLVRKFDPQVFFHRLWNRVSLYTGDGQDREKRRLLDHSFDRVRMWDGRTEWWELERRSYSQGAKHDISGVTGWAHLGPLTPELWALLYLGEVLHVGAKTAFGLGRYKIMRDAFDSLQGEQRQHSE